MKAISQSNLIKHLTRKNGIVLVFFLSNFIFILFLTYSIERNLTGLQVHYTPIWIFYGSQG